MDALLALLKPSVVSAMVLCPIVLQIARGRFKKFAAAHAAVVNFAVVAGVVVWTLRLDIVPPTVANLDTLATQVAVAWFLSDKWFTGMVEPMAKSSNPLMPSATNGGSK